MFYYDPSNPGHGVAVSDLGTDNYVGAWYCFDAVGRQMWLTLQDGKLYQPSAGAGFPVGGKAKAGKPAGSYTLTMSTDGGTLVLTYDIKSDILYGDLDFSPTPPTRTKGAIALKFLA